VSTGEIDVVTRYQVRCQMCLFSRDAETAREAETLACDHLEEESAHSVLLNWNHKVAITQVTLCGKNLH
jgi:Holliday junction resolvase-like predicted endonuclease